MEMPGRKGASMETITRPAGRPAPAAAIVLADQDGVSYRMGGRTADHTVFDGSHGQSERDYQAWLTTHPDAYVLTLPRTWRDQPTDRFALHHADCFHMRDYIVGVGLPYGAYFRPPADAPGTTAGAFVEQGSITICSVSRAALERFTEANSAHRLVPVAECSCHHRARRP